MASFAIAEGPTTLQLVHAAGRWSANATFSVTNITASAKTALLRVRPDAIVGSPQFTIEGSPLVEFAPSETRALPIQFAITEDASGEVVFHLRVVNEADPNNDWVDGAAVRAMVPPSPGNGSTDDATIFYEDADTRIDAHFAKFGSKTIPIRAITAIETEPRRPGRVWALLALAGAGLSLLGLAAAHASGWLIPAFGFAWVAWMQWRRRSLRLKLTTSGGSIQPLRTKDAKIVSAIRAALERALQK